MLLKVWESLHSVFKIWVKEAESKNSGAVVFIGMTMILRPI